MEKKENANHIFVLECLEEALIRLMNKKNYADITISELCEVAGVSRISYYRNYNNFDEIILNYLNKKTDDWWTNFTNSQDMLSGNFWVGISQEYLKHKNIIQLIYKQNLSRLIKEHIFSRCGPKKEQPQYEKYATSVIAGAIYGYLDMWFQNDMVNPPFELNLKVMLNLYKLMVEHSNKEI